MLHNRILTVPISPTGVGILTHTTHTKMGHADRGARITRANNCCTCNYLQAVELELLRDSYRSPVALDPVSLYRGEV